MAILTTDVDTRLSGGAGNSDPDASLGGVKSSTELSPTVGEENLFSNVDGAEAAAGSTKYRGLYFHNGHASLTLESTFIWFSTQTPSTDTIIAMALAGEGLNATMETVADEDTAPVGESFTEPATKAGGLNMGNVPFSQHFGFWVRRIVTGSASAFDNDDWAYTIEGDTAA